MSPEQCTGAQLDVRSDIYSVGVCMYEALTGRVPHLGKNYVETMSLQIMAEPRTFSQVCPGKLFPPGLEQVVRKALEKEPEKRYQTMGELRADLEQAIPLNPVSEQRSKNASRHLDKFNNKQTRTTGDYRARTGFRERIGQLMPNFAKLCIVLAVLAVITLAAQIIGEYLKTEPYWTKDWKDVPEFSSQEADKK